MEEKTKIRKTKQFKKNKHIRIRTDVLKKTQISSLVRTTRFWNNLQVKRLKGQIIDRLQAISNTAVRLLSLKCINEPFIVHFNIVQIAVICVVFSWDVIHSEHNDDIKQVTRRHKLKDRQHNDQKKKDRQNNDQKRNQKP